MSRYCLRTAPTSGQSHFYSGAYNRGLWQRFLESEGYRAMDRAAFGKAVPAPAVGAVVIEEDTDR